MKCKIFPVRKKEPPNETKTGNAANRDSIKSKVFERGGMGVRGKGGILFALPYSTNTVARPRKRKKPAPSVMAVRKMLEA